MDSTTHRLNSEIELTLLGTSWRKAKLKSTSKEMSEPHVEWVVEFENRDKTAASKKILKMYFDK